MRLTTVLLGVTRALAAVKARCSAPPPLRGADGLDAGSAHARPGSCLTMTNSPTPESEATSRPEITVRRAACKTLWGAGSILDSPVSILLSWTADCAFWGEKTAAASPEAWKDGHRRVCTGTGG